MNTDDSVEIVPISDIKSAKKVSVQSENTDDSSDIIEMNKKNQEKMTEENADKSTPTRSTRGKRRVCNEMQNVELGTTSTPKNRGRPLKDFNTTLSPIEERRGSDVENKKPPEKNKIKRLGVKGPATKVTIAMTDVSPKLQGHSGVTIKKIGDADVIVRLRCSYCKKTFYMQTAYETHLLMDHKFRNFRLHPPEIVKQHEITCSSISPLLSSDDAHNKTLDKDGSIGKSPSRSENTDQKDGSLPEIKPPKQHVKPFTEEFPGHSCDTCTESFFYPDGLRLHKEHCGFRASDVENDFITPISQNRDNRNSKEEESENTNATSKDVKKTSGRKSKSIEVPVKLKEKVVENIVKASIFTRSQLKKLQATADSKEKAETEKLLLEDSGDLSREAFAKEFKLKPTTPVENDSTLTAEDTSQLHSSMNDKSENTLSADNVNALEMSQNTDATNVEDDADESKNTNLNTNNDLSSEDDEPPNFEEPHDDTDMDPNYSPPKNDGMNSDSSEGKPDDDEEQEVDKEPIVKPIPKATKPKKTKSKGTKPKVVKKEQPDDDDIDDFKYYCDKCNADFVDFNEMKKHKFDCVRIPRKHVCSKCNRGFQQRCLMQQHFDYYHTNKPKRFVCVEHRKTYVYKKSLAEHNIRAHSQGQFRFVCDFCGKGFFHKSEFTIHRKSVHLNIRDYACNRCQERSFTSIGRLNAHLERCGKQANIECNQCGKLFSKKEALYIHISDTHRKDIKYSCPICKEKVYDSQGGWYGHLRQKHDISRKTVKLTDFIKSQEIDMENTDVDSSKNTDPSNKSFDVSSENTDDSKIKEQEFLNLKNRSIKKEIADEKDKKTKSKPKKGTASKVEPVVNDKKPKPSGNKPKPTPKATKEPKNKPPKTPVTKPNRKTGTKSKPKTPDKDDVKETNIPKKRTRADGPISWECPYCDKVYALEIKYFTHLYQVHKHKVPGVTFD